jgi:hypothetical protein
VKKSRAEWLQEALLLEQLGSEWEVGHVAAFCTASESFIYRSGCPRIEKEGVRGVKGKAMIRFEPAKVRQWNATRTRKEAA